MYEITICGEPVPATLGADGEVIIREYVTAQTPLTIQLSSGRLEGRLWQDEYGGVYVRTRAGVHAVTAREGVLVARPSERSADGVNRGESVPGGTKGKSGGVVRKTPARVRKR